MSSDTRNVGTLDYQIAEQLGYRFERIGGTPASWGDVYRVFKPDGAPCLRETAYSTKNEWPEYVLDLAYEEYSTDNNVAVEMMNNVGRHYTIRCWQDKPMPPRYGVHIHGMRYEYPADTLAEACCKAFLGWTNTEANTVTFETLADENGV